MNFYTQTLIQLMFALGAAMVFGNIVALLRRSKDRELAQAALRSAPRASRHQTKALAKGQIKAGKATLAVAPVGRSVTFIGIGIIVMLWSGITLLR